MVIQNLPRSECFKTSNIILVGLMLGPKEPRSVNPYLVDDLRKPFHGVDISIPSISDKVRVRAALTCVVCDLPAARKVCGFLSVHATQECSKCRKSFLTASFGSKPGFE